MTVSQKAKARILLAAAAILLIVLIAVLSRGGAKTAAPEPSDALPTPQPAEDYQILREREMSGAEYDEAMALLRGFADGSPIRIEVWTSSGDTIPASDFTLADFIDAQSWTVRETDEGLADDPDDVIIVTDGAGHSLYIADTRDWVEVSADVGDEPVYPPHYNYYCGLTGREIVDALLPWAMENGAYHGARNGW